MHRAASAYRRDSLRSALIATPEACHYYREASVQWHLPLIAQDLPLLPTTHPAPPLGAAAEQSAPFPTAPMPSHPLPSGSPNYPASPRPSWPAPEISGTRRRVKSRL